ncbi:MAG TPA: hypothetical protein ENK57_25470 [Polyangiaceae bacterium]|nr:hypothetical protein [Polyangiaceae bacterium]
MVVRRGIRRRSVLALGALGAYGATVALGVHRALAGELPGQTIDYHWDGKDVGRPHLAWTGRAYVPPRAAVGDVARPLLVFLHGLNAALIPHRWMGGGREGDVRAIVGRLVSSGKVAPLVVAGPSSVVRSQVAKGASWNHFDLDRFIDRTVSQLKGEVAIDESKIVVAGHSGAGCSTAGGLATVGQSRRRLLAILAIDTCMAPAIALKLAESDARTHVVVTYQRRSWTKRPFTLFERSFERAVNAHPPRDGVLRAVIELTPDTAPHDRCVPMTLERFLPALLPVADEGKIGR